MFLILEVTGREAAALGAASRAIFTTAGGSIGRRAGNDWVLPDPHVSGRHARVRAIGGTLMFLSHLAFAYNVWLMRPRDSASTGATTAQKGAS